MSEQHEKVKRILRIVGIVLLVAGAGCSVAGFVDIILSFRRMEMSTLFFLVIIGLPFMGLGLGLLLVSFHRELARYAKNETVPVINEASKEITPAIRAVTDAVKGEKKCPHCGAVSTEDNAFCPACGKPLTKTCPHCGSKQDAKNAFCGNCGQKLS